MEPKYLGKPATGPIEELDAFPAPDGLSHVTMVSDEVTCLGPVNSAPDFYTIRIEYAPDKLCIESKSLKLYLWHFRDTVTSCEDLAVTIRDKVVESIRPKWCQVTAAQKARGGIAIEAVSTFGG